MERRYADIGKRIQRKGQVLDMAEKGLSGACQEMDQARAWLREKRLQVQQAPMLGFEAKQADEKIQGLKVSS